MKQLLIILLIMPISLFAIEKSDSIATLQNTKIVNNIEKIETIQKEIKELNQKHIAQGNLHDKTINSISSQIGAVSYNLTIFGILFAIGAIVLGIYVTRIENKVVRIREENTSLLNQTIKNKEEVVAINNLIQKDINGLYEKIKREETLHLLNRLTVVPEDITNLGDLLVSRELEREDFQILKKAYLKIKNCSKEPRALFSSQMSYAETYKLLFFQHFLDLAIKDKDIGPDLIDYYQTGISCSFENDIIKSSTDFIKAIIELDYSSKGDDIGNFIKGLSISKFQDFKKLYKILFDNLKYRDDQFNFFDLILDDKESRVGKSNYGKILQSSYSSTELNENERKILEKTTEIIEELKKEKEERLTAEQKRKEAAEKKKQEQQKKKK